MNIICVYNKIDLTKTPVSSTVDKVYLSVKTGAGLPLLIEVLAKRLGKHEHGDTPFLARRRHLVALQHTHESIQQALNQCKQNVNLELVAEDLRIAQQYLGEVTGEFTSDDLLGMIFSEFCIGK